MRRDPWQRALGAAVLTAVLVATVVISWGLTRVAAQSGPDSPAATAGAAPGDAIVAPPTVTDVEGSLSEYSISLSEVAVPTGTVRFAVENVGQQRHDLRVVGNGVDRQTRELRPGQSGDLEVTFDEPGIFTVYCDLADHADRGMTTTLTVEDGAAFTQS
jgi:uncharacterized cupredoxin-like copper-binding protein